MPPTVETARRFAWLQHLTKGVAVVASTGAAIASIVSALHSNGVIGKGAASTAAANAAAWVRITPTVDTATALGDTIAFAATVADRAGSILPGAVPTWTTGDSSVATVGTDGSVVARGPGVTTVSAVVGKLVTRGHVIVRQRVAAVTVAPVGPMAGDSALVLVEGSRLPLRARAVDARGHPVTGRSLALAVDDTLVATADAQGVLAALGAGHATARATIDGVSATLRVTVTPTAAALSLVEGGAQRALAGHRLPREITVLATTRRGAPAPGMRVAFRTRDALGTIEPATATTDAEGRARAAWTLGAAPGEQVLLASVDGVDSVVAVRAEADPTVSNVRVIPLAYTLRAPAGATLRDSVGVRVTDSLDRPLAGVPVRWSTAQGTVQAVEGRTDSNGVANARWTLAPRTGAQRLRALIGAADSRIVPAEIVVAAQAGRPAAIAVVSGDRQRGAAGAMLGRPVVLRVVDSAGNAAAFVPVLLAPSAGTVRDSAVHTDSLGLVQVRWTMARSAGEHALAARVLAGDGASVRVTARGISGAPANLAIEQAAGSAGASGGGARALVAVATDLHGNPVADATLTFTATSGTVVPARAVTDADGRVTLRWTPAAGPGEQTLRGRVRGSDVTGVHLLVAPTRAKSLTSVPRRRKDAR